MGLMVVIKVVNSDLHYCYKYDIMNCNAIDLLMALEARLNMYLWSLEDLIFGQPIWPYMVVPGQI